MTAPLTPPDCDLTDFQRMMIDIPRLRGSDFDATLNDGAWRAGLNLWLSSWHQVPAGSLSDDDTTLTKAAGLGRDIRTWRKVKAEALRGWVKCDDGLLYHPVVAEFALEAWLEKLAQALSSGAGNAKRWKVDFDPEPIEADIDRTAEMLCALNPKSKALVKLERRRSRTHPEEPAGGNPDGTKSLSRQDAQTIPSGSLGTGTGKGTLRTPPRPPEGASGSVFDEAWRAYPETTTSNREKSWLAWEVAAAELGEAVLLACVVAYAAHQRAAGAKAKPTPGFHRWLVGRRFDSFVKAARVTADWSGPSWFWDAVVAERSREFAISWILPCGWQDLPRALLSPGPTVTTRLGQEIGSLLRDAQVEVLERAA